MTTDNLVWRLEQRLEVLKTERESGEKMLADLSSRQMTLRDTMLRISGAIQVLEEELAQARQLAADNGRANDRSVRPDSSAATSTSS